MAITSQFLTRIRKRKISNFAVQMIRKLEWNLGDALGLIQITSGLEPKIIRTPRVALEQWRYALRNAAHPHKGKLLIVALRNRTWIEWAVFTCCYAYRMGYEPVLLYSSSELAKIYHSEHLTERFGFSFWEGVEKTQEIKRIDVDSFFPEDDIQLDDYAEFARRAAHTSAAYDLRVEEFEGCEIAKEYEEAVQNAERMLCIYGKAVEDIMQQMPVKRVICPSGIISWSLAVREGARRVGTTAMFVEGFAIRPGHMIWNSDRPALDFDLKGWIKILGEWDETKESDIRNFKAFQEQDEVVHEDWLENFHPAQRSQKNRPFPPALVHFLRRPGPRFLLGTNVVGDSATLRRATIFRSQRDWLLEVITFFKRQRHLNLIIRAHPNEIWGKFARQRMGRVAKEAVRDAENIFVISGEEDINTYALIDRVDVGLIWVSSLGSDMILRGKPTVVAANAPYSELGVGCAPTSVDEYFQLILKMAKNPIPPDEEMIRNCKIYQWIIFKKMSLQAAGKRWMSPEYRLGKDKMHPDQEVFYRILVGELSEKGQPLPASEESELSSFTH